MSRTGSNPEKNSTCLYETKQHRIIIPVYIPDLTGYFKNMLEILDICLTSLRKTITEEDAVTIISNGCCDEVIMQLMEYKERGWIDQLIINRINYGKIDALLSIARGCHENFITFADCDAFFYPGWQAAMMELFCAFPEAGWVSTQPSVDTGRLNTVSTTTVAFTKGLLRKRRIEATAPLNRFGESIGRPEMFLCMTKKYYLVVKRYGISAIVGGNHFTFTIRKQILAQIPHKPSLKFVGEEEILGQPLDKIGYWRLSTCELHIQHMGNTPEQWMYDDLNNSCEGSNVAPRYRANNFKIVKPFPFIIKSFFFRLMKTYRLTRILKDG